MLVVAVGLALRLPGVLWGVATHERFQVDESQHVGIAINVLHRVDPRLVSEALVTPQWNGRAFGAQIALLGYPILRFLTPDVYVLHVVGRLLAAAYGAGLILVVYVLAHRIAGRRSAALLAASLVAISDLDVTYGHMAVPVEAYVCVAYLTLLLFADFWCEDAESRRARRLLLGVGVGLGINLAMRFDIVLPIVVLTGLVVRYGRRALRPWRLAQALALTAAAAGAAFFVAVAFDYNLADARQSLHVLLTESQNVVPVDHHLLWNPVLYFAALVAGTSLPVFGLFLLGLRRLARQPDASIPVRLLAAFVAGTFVLLWVGDATFVRRADVFVPFMAIVGGCGGMLVLERLPRRAARMILAGVVLYTLGLTLVSQRQFLADTRYAAARFLGRLAPAPTSIGYSAYAKLNAMPPGVNISDAATDLTTPPEVLVLHEARYGRYWRSFTTPFEVPRCCEEVYHCSHDECVLTQRIFSGTSAYRLLARFAAPEIFPERVLFKRVFGTYETMLGDVRIYRRS